MLDCAKEDLFSEVNQFFLNTWDRHGSGHRPDAPRNDLRRLRPSNPDQLHGSENLRNISSNQKKESSSGRDTQGERMHGSINVPSQHASYPLESTSGNSSVSTVTHPQTQMIHGNTNLTRSSDMIRKETNSDLGAHIDKGQRSAKPDNLVNDLQGRFLFARTRSSPELTDTYGEVSTQSRRKAPESGKGQTSARLDNSRRKNLDSDSMASQRNRSTDDPSSARSISSRQSLDAAVDSNNYLDESGMSVVADDYASVSGTQGMHQEEQDLVNMMASSAAHGFNGQVHLPLNLASGHLPASNPTFHSCFYGICSEKYGWNGSYEFPLDGDSLGHKYAISPRCCFAVTGPLFPWHGVDLKS